MITKELEWRPSKEPPPKGGVYFIKNDNGYQEAQIATFKESRGHFVQESPFVRTEFPLHVTHWANLK